MCGQCSSKYMLWKSWLYRYNTIVPEISGKLSACTNSEALVFPAHWEPWYEAKLYHAFQYLQPKPTMYCTGTATPVESVHNHCCSPSVHLLRSRTWRVGLTLVSEGSGSLATLQPIHEHFRLRSGSNWGCRIQQMRGGSTNLFTLCKVYLVSIPHYWDTVSDTVCQLVK